MLEFFDLANNPIFIKHIRSRLRRSAVIPALLLIFIASAVIVVIDANVRDNDPDTTQGSTMFFWLQMFLLIVIGGSQIASAIAQVRDSGILDYHRLTPLPSGVQTIGFLLGAPIREYILYLITFPFALYCALICDVGVFGFAKLFLVQVAVVLMSHSLALITGLASRSARGASGTFVVVATILNGASVLLYTQGIYGPSLLSSYPVYHDVILSKAFARAQQQQLQWQQQQQQQQQFPPRKQGQFAARPQQQGGNPRQARQAGPPTFFGGEMPVVLQSLFFQGTFITFLFIAASRRIRSARIPMLSKTEALVCLSCVGFLTLGSFWGSFQIVAVMGTLCFLMLLALVFSAILTPDQGEIGKGLQRSYRLLDGHVPFWHDLTSMKMMVPILAFLTVLPAVIAAATVPAPQNNDPWLPWPPVATAFFTILSFGFARQAIPLSVGKRWPGMFALYVVLIWGMPVAFGGIAHALGMHEAVYAMVISPLMGIIASSRLVFADADQTAIMLLSIVPPIMLTLLFFSILVASEKRVVSAVVEEQEHRYPKVIA